MFRKKVLVRFTLILLLSFCFSAACFCQSPGAENYSLVEVEWHAVTYFASGHINIFEVTVKSIKGEVLPSKQWLNEQKASTEFSDAVFLSAVNAEKEIKFQTNKNWKMEKVLGLIARGMKGRVFKFQAQDKGEFAPKLRQYGPWQVWEDKSALSLGGSSGNGFINGKVYNATLISLTTDVKVDLSLFSSEKLNKLNVSITKLLPGYCDYVYSLISLLLFLLCFY